MRPCVGFGAAFLAAGLSGCAENPTLDDGGSIAGTVRLETVTNSLKCGLAKALSADRQGYAGLYGATARVTLDVNLVRANSERVGGSVGIPVFQGAATVTPSFGFSNEATRTYNSRININFNLLTHSDAICQKIEKQNQDGGFSLWLGEAVSQTYSSVAGPPKSSIQTYVYETNFVVVANTNADLSVTSAIVPIKASASFASSRQDVQHMTIAIDAVHFVPGRGKQAGGVEKRSGAKPKRVEPGGHFDGGSAEHVKDLDNKK